MGLRAANIDDRQPAVETDRLGEFLDSRVRLFVKRTAPCFTSHSIAPLERFPRHFYQISRGGEKDAKSDPNVELRIKFELQNLQTVHLSLSAFGFRICFGFRHSDFGFSTLKFATNGSNLCHFAISAFDSGLIVILRWDWAPDAICEARIWAQTGERDVARDQDMHGCRWVCALLVR